MKVTLARPMKRWNDGATLQNMNTVSMLPYKGGMTPKVTAELSCAT